MGLGEEHFCALGGFFEDLVHDGHSCFCSKLAVARLMLLPAARERRGAGRSGGCSSELSPYVHRHPGDWCNMERFSV